MAKLNAIRTQRLKDIETLMFKVKHDLFPEYIEVLFQKNISSYNLRNFDFIIPRYNTVKYGKHSLKYAGPFVWSKLTNDIKNAISLSAFKYMIRKTN